MSNFSEDLKNKRLYFDGAMGTLLQTKGLLKGGELPEYLNLTNGEEISAIHKSYFDAGCNVVCTNTFGANLLKFREDELEKIIAAAIENAKKARELSKWEQTKYIALDMGPLGRLLKPYGDLEFEKAVEIFGKTAAIGAAKGADLIFIETMNDCLETKAALLGAKENCDLPVIISNSYNEDGKLMSGTTPQAIVAMAEGLGACAIGINCSTGPLQMTKVISELLENASVPVIVKPNAGLPVEMNGETVFNVTADEFSEQMKKIALMGINILGGCCGTTPEYMQKTIEKTQNIPFAPVTEKEKTLVASYTHSVELGRDPVIIGERINPTGKKRFKQALVENDINYILKEGIGQQECGADILDVNVGLPEIDEPTLLKEVVYQLQGVSDLPLQIDTSNGIALERALRLYNGKAMINSVNGKEESIKTVFPLAKKYGGVVVALTLDENGIPENAEGRIEIARKILRYAEIYGISKKNIVFDTLSMSVATNTSAAVETLKALKYIREELGVNTVLGISNISFGLPKRDAVNSQFLSMALQNGLSAAIVNPFSVSIMKTFYSYRLLSGMDENCTQYIDYVKDLPEGDKILPSEIKKTEVSDENLTLGSAIIKGLKNQSAGLTDRLLESTEPMEIINSHIIPALDAVGKGFEKNTLFLPQLLISAEAAKCAFERIKSAVAKSGKAAEKKDKFVLATVKGDIHDIGKNIVKVLLENYGFEVFDLGRDVPPEKILDCVTKENARFCGLSALMTTTVPAMEETVKLLRKEAPKCKIIVGGAVLNEEYAQKIGADFYGKDAMATVRYAEENSLK